MARIGLQFLIIVWWIGAVLAGISLLSPVYYVYVVLGTTGWTVVLSTTGLIVYEIKRIKEEDKKKQLVK
jgi:hypothetical protein